MKKLLLLLVLVSAFNTIQAQTPSDCTVPPLLATEYKRDIVQLATCRLFQLQSPDTSFVKIPHQYTDSISEGLAAILNATSLAERDTVFNLYCVHNHNGWPYGYAGFLVRVDTTFPWTHAWQNMITTTGDPFIDGICTRYGLQIHNFYNWSFGNYAELATDSSWNIFALIDSIEMTAGVISAETNGIIGAAGTITYSTIGTDRYYNFYFEFNDCFDGCDNYRMWRFKVYHDCSVEYLGFTDWGYFGISGLPAPINCNTFSSVAVDKLQKENCMVFPNPADDVLTIKTLTYTDGGTYLISDLTGRIILSGKLDLANTTINIGQLTKGIYLLHIGDENTITFKVIKN